jgi:predicted PurR-regulated permease PerM
LWVVLIAGSTGSAFVNARIIGVRIRAYAWELLVAMLVMDAWFGIPGLVAVPIYYAYIKQELTDRGLLQ